MNAKFSKIRMSLRFCVHTDLSIRKSIDLSRQFEGPLLEDLGMQMVQLDLIISRLS